MKVTYTAECEVADTDYITVAEHEVNKSQVHVEIQMHDGSAFVILSADDAVDFGNCLAKLGHEARLYADG